MTTFLLIPGAGGAAWSWHLVARGLHARGHRAVAVDLPADDELTGTIEPSGRPVDELDLHDRRPGLDEMLNPNSRVGMGQMEPRPIPPITGTDTNAELNDPNATDTAIDQ